MKNTITYILLVFCVALLPLAAQAQCPDSENALRWGRLAISSFYANSYYAQDRQQMGVSTNDLSEDEIVPVTDASVCSQIEAKIAASNKYDTRTKNQSKVYFKNEQTGRYFFVAYTEPAQYGWSTGVYILDADYNKLGGFGV